MAKVSKSFKGGQKGFTLIELLIVIVILGVLAAAIIPNLSKFIGRGNVGAANAELASVRTALAAYQADNDGAVPVTTTAAGEDALLEYMVGSSGIRGMYTWTATGLITGATNGTGSTGSVAWPATIQFSGTEWEDVP